MPHETEVLALVDRASAIVYRGIIGACPVERASTDRTQNLIGSSKYRQIPG
jgi:hypothetical protein